MDEFEKLSYEHKIVGHLYNGAFYCPDCYKAPKITDSDPCPVYRINIGIYSQQCSSCKKLIVEGINRSDGRGPLNLFDKGLELPPMQKEKV